MPSPLTYRPTVNAVLRRCDNPSLVVRDPAFAFLEGTSGDVCSQNGEDGVIAALFARFGTRNRWCFEVGANDGIRCSNVWALHRCGGWQAVLIEADADLFDLLRKNCGHARLFHETIGPDSLDRILAAAGAPVNMDLGVIDIDGEDIRAWEGLRVYRPRVMLVEYNPDGDGILGGRTEWQAGLDSIAMLGRRKGYRLAATTACNALFVDEGEL